jgi:hypothetical protein
MKIHFNKALGTAIIVIGVLDILMILVFALLGARISMGGLFILLAVVLGILFLTRPYFVIDGKTLEVRALIGPAATTFKFTQPQDFSVEKYKVFLTAGRERQLLPIFGWLAYGREWKAFVRWTQTGKWPEAGKKNRASG